MKGQTRMMCAFHSDTWGMFLSVVTQETNCSGVWKPKTLNILCHNLCQNTHPWDIWTIKKLSHKYWKCTCLEHWETTKIYKYEIVDHITDDIRRKLFLLHKTFAKAPTQIFSVAINPFNLHFVGIRFYSSGLWPTNQFFWTPEGLAKLCLVLSQRVFAGQLRWIRQEQVTEF